ncbi:MAG: flagellar basal body P-ring protein FlgI [Aestuariivirga sp.]|uniref:flagellar basal body P-ring protein FlgI n=1 Tax=Aestuariivirga sp. TaxID=2650926 RepID=UPI0038CF4AF6
MTRLLLFAVALCCLCQTAYASSRIKDISDVNGIRENQLVGYGLVIGLAGTGDTMRNSPFTEQSTRSMLLRFGVAVPQNAVRARNIAAVVVTAKLPPFVSAGERIDVSVSSLGDATSLRGGTLVMTPLSAADGNAYAVAQGAISVSGLAAQGAAEQLTEGVPTGGRIPGGALIERELAADFNQVAELSLKIRNPDFSTAAKIADVINRYSAKAFGAPIAQAEDFRTVSVKRPKKISASRLMAAVGNLNVEPDSPARVVIDEKTGTIVIGAKVRVSPVAIAHGNITIRVTETPEVIQPLPFSDGETAVQPSTEIAIEQAGDKVAKLEGPSLERLVHGLNRIGLKPSGIIAILQAIKTAGALQADLVIQ